MTVTRLRAPLAGPLADAEAAPPPSPARIM
jgi:hypothetical protein